jgi:hypothetical protein
MRLYLVRSAMRIALEVAAFNRHAVESHMIDTFLLSAEAFSQVICRQPTEKRSEITLS